MRKLALATLMVSLGLLGAASMASATSVTLAITGAAGTAISSTDASGVTVAGTGTASITVDIQLDVDSRGSSSAFLSLNFDTDNGNELNVVSFEELGWTKVMMGMTTAAWSQLSVGALASTQESTGAQEGQLYTFEGTSTGQGPASTSLTFARVVFSINTGNVSTDGDDLFSGIFAGVGNDGIYDNQSPTADEISGSVSFGSLAVNLVPEPGTLTLLGLGMGALVLSGRRRRH